MEAGLHILAKAASVSNVAQKFCGRNFSGTKDGSTWAHVANYRNCSICNRERFRTVRKLCNLDLDKVFILYGYLTGYITT